MRRALAIILAFAVLATLACGGAWLWMHRPWRVIATVDGDALTSNDLDLRLKTYGGGRNVTEGDRREMVRAWIAKQILLGEAVRRNAALAEGDGSVRIPEGEEAPPLYLFHADVSTDAEQVVLPVTLHKQFCSLEMRFKGPSGYGPPFEVAVEGFYGGWEPDGSPAPGSFSRRLLPGADGRAVLRLPRQGDDSLLMHIVFSDQVVRTFALGSYIAAAGYDWNAPDLEDLSLQVDISLTSVTISTDLWSRTEDIELWI